MVDALVKRMESPVRYVFIKAIFRSALNMLRNADQSDFVSDDCLPGICNNAMRVYAVRHLLMICSSSSSLPSSVPPVYALYQTPISPLTMWN